MEITLKIYVLKFPLQFDGHNHRKLIHIQLHNAPVAYKRIKITTKAKFIY